MKNVLFLMIAFTITACGDKESKLDQPPAPTTPQRHLGEEFVKKYMTEKLKIFKDVTCDRWEDGGYGKSQSVMCIAEDVLLIHCVAGNGVAPRCDVVVDKRPQPEPPKKK